LARAQRLHARASQQQHCAMRRRGPSPLALPHQSAGWRCTCQEWPARRCARQRQALRGLADPHPSMIQMIQKNGLSNDSKMEVAHDVNHHNSQIIQMSQIIRMIQ
jgi:hypothetical protein